MFAGLDGWLGEFIKELDPTSALLLCDLLDDCNEGNFPDFFVQARTVGIPKNDGTNDRRPLTVMSALYRLWARRIARHTGAWMDFYMPKTAYGQITRTTYDSMINSDIPQAPQEPT